MKEFNVGDKFDMKGVNLEVCEFENSFDCDKCYFFKEDDCIAHETILCSADKRKDGKFVYFKEF